MPVAAMGALFASSLEVDFRPRKRSRAQLLCLLRTRR
jgi:hypothetical protein